MEKRTQCWRCGKYVSVAYWTSINPGGAKGKGRILCGPCVDLVRPTVHRPDSFWVGKEPVENRTEWPPRQIGSRR